MKTYYVDEIIRSALLTCGKPIHYYMEFLHYGLKGIKEINYDSPIRTKSTKITVNSNNEVVLPDDYVDYIRIGFEQGQYVINLTEKTEFNRLQNFDSAGNQIPFEDATNNFVYANTHYESTHTNHNGEHIGKYFGHSPSYKGAFMVVPERNVILIDPSQALEEVVIDYITTGIGLETNARTVIPAYGAEAVERYILWRYKENSTVINRHEAVLAKEEYIQAYKRFRSREFRLSVDDVLRSLRSNTHASIKS